MAEPIKDAKKKTFTVAGQYVEEIRFEQKRPDPIVRASTSTAAFIGRTKSGPCNKAVLVNNFGEFENIFGGFISEPRQYLAYAVDLFFKNGGDRAYIVRAEEMNQNDKAPMRISVVKRLFKRQDAMDIDAALSALEKADDASIIAAPGICGEDVYEKLIVHCSKMKCRFAILDPPSGCSVDQVIKIRSAEMISGNGMAATYYPWLQIADPVTKKNITVPPSGAVAGVYANSDNRNGVHKAPANISLASVMGLETNISTQDQEHLNVKNINAIRAFTGKGFVVWGARTISDDPDLRYINVRRLLLHLEQSIYNSTKWVLTEPNDGNLWAKFKTIIEDFLTGAWREGMLTGAKPEDAFYVKCGLGQTMTAEDIMNGRMIAEIGVAPSRPAEFVRICFSYDIEK